ncbi:G-D-S-L family lipolytic protein [Sphingomonas sp. LH128]|uniref:SGNH/GDSL hydrolase family protein n=1 Tax=Sphingomonas sp. LH128 TaxID=473781 RepID=UPI00027C9B22|nr:SGNH/GDSL hydrolase family protein [Sphingomonas sp. LH128]EJU14135.1 G-D-S-L family lipolytic protein [Sphingomonas sp. LH128]
MLAAITELQQNITGVVSGIPAYATAASLPAVTSADNGKQARVYADGTAANNTFWIVQGGAWAIDTAYVALLNAVVQPLVDQAVAARDAAIAAMAGIDAPAVSSAVYRKNLFNLATLTDNNYVSPTGALESNVQYFASAWIAWPAGVTQVTLSRGNWLVQAIYSGGVYTAISGTSVNPGTQNYTLTKASGATHFRLSSQKANQPAATFMAVPGTVLPTEYVPYDKVLDLSKAIPGLLSGTALATGTLTADKTAFIEFSKNILNLSGLTVGMALSNAGSPLTSAQNSYTTYLPVTPGQQYVSSQNGVATNMRMWCFFANTSGTVVSGGSNDPGNTFTAPAGAYYVRVTVYNATTSGAQLEAGSSATPYAVYGLKLKPDGYGSGGSGSSSRWYGKSAAFLGDSITQGNTWQGYVAAILGLIITSFGIGGTKISGPAGDTNAMCQEARITAIGTTFDLIHLMGGTNDWAQNVPLGDLDGWYGTASFATSVMTVTAVGGGPTIKVGDTVNAAGVTPGTYITSLGTGTGGAGTYNLSTTPGTLAARRTRTFDPTTFYGALNTWADRSFARWPGKRLSIGTTPYGEIPDYVPRGWSSPAHNTLGLTTNDYAEAIRKFAARRNVALSDVALNGGWGASNIVTAMGGSTTDNLHPATDSPAAKGIGSAQVAGLRQIEPVS